MICSRLLRSVGFGALTRSSNERAGYTRWVDQRESPSARVRLGLFDACRRPQERDGTSARAGRRRISPMEETAECHNAVGAFAAMAIDSPGCSVMSDATQSGGKPVGR
jgi:hypothetical protein